MQILRRKYPLVNNAYNSHFDRGIGNRCVQIHPTEARSVLSVFIGRGQQRTDRSMHISKFIQNFKISF